MRQFYVYKRSTGVYYAEFFNDKGVRVASRSTRKRNRDEAVVVAHQWASEGLPASKGNTRPLDTAESVSGLLGLTRNLEIGPADAARIVSILRQRGLISVSIKQNQGIASEKVSAFLARYWVDDSPYILDRKAWGVRIGKRHAYEMRRRVALYWVDYFKKTTLGEVTRADLKAFAVHLAGRGLSAGSIAKIMQAGTTIFRWAYDNEMIAADPSEGLGKASGPARKRGVLTDSEVQAVFASPWKDERARIGCNVALTCGLRAGEILGLRKEDIADAWLTIRHSWSELDDLKSTKTEEERRVALIKGVRDELLGLLKKNPHGDSPESFVFYDPQSATRPMKHYVLRAGLDDVLIRLTLGEGYEAATQAERREALKPWRARAVSLHSFRHLYATKLAERVSQGVAMRSTGHSSRAVFEAYSNHEDENGLDEVRGAVEESLGKLLPFKPASGA